MKKCFKLVLVWCLFFGKAMQYIFQSPCAVLSHVCLTAFAFTKRQLKLLSASCSKLPLITKVIWRVRQFLQRGKHLLWWQPQYIPRQISAGMRRFAEPVIGYVTYCTPTSTSVCARLMFTCFWSLPCMHGLVTYHKTVSNAGLESPGHSAKFSPPSM